MLTINDYKNLIAIISTHPTPEGVGSPQGQEKTRLINEISKLVSEQEHGTTEK